MLNITLKKKKKTEEPKNVYDLTIEAVYFDLLENSDGVKDKQDK